MKGRILLLDKAVDGGSRAALLVDGRLEDLLLDGPSGEFVPAPDDIYRATVDRMVPKIGAAFVRLGSNCQGYLREIKGLREGEKLLVQVTGYPEPGKAVPISGRVIYKGRRLIHTPGAPGINVSRQVRAADERDRLVAALEGLESAEGGFILRTLAAGAPAEELREEAADLRIRREKCEALKELGEVGPVEVVSAATRALREWTSPLPDAVILPGAMQCKVGSGLGAVLQVTDQKDIFDLYGVWDEVGSLRSARVDLPSGAWMAVEATRAMVTVDVNTGGEFGGGSALTANIEAARALPRQLRLRGLGGQIIVDFAPLKKMHRKQVEEAMKVALRKDPVETTLAGWTPLGNFELTRKRERRPLTELVGQG